MTYLKIAFRNIFRNKRRSFITLSAIGFGVASLIMFGGFITNLMLMLGEGTVWGGVGHIQVYRKGFSENFGENNLFFTLKNYKQLIEKLNSIEDVWITTPRLQFTGLISTGESTVSFMATGIDPEKEGKFTSALNFIEGENLMGTDGDNAILGEGLARELGVKSGSVITLLTTTRDGAINAMDFLVKGIYRSGIEALDRRSLKIPIRKAQELLYMDEVQTLVMVLNKTRNTAVVRNRLKGLINREKLNIEFKTWVQLSTFYRQSVDFLKGIFRVLQLIIAIVIVLGIMNATIMSVFERTREIGTIMALGDKRKKVLIQFLLEGGILGVIGGVCGILLGFLFSMVINLLGGIPLPSAPGATIPINVKIHMGVQVLISSFAIVVISSFLSSVFPSWKASRLEIVDALRHV